MAEVVSALHTSNMSRARWLSLATGLAVVVVGLVVSTRASAEPPLRTHDPQPRWGLVTQLPITSLVKSAPDPYDPRLLVRQLGLARWHSIWLAPGLELTLVNPNTLATLEIMGKGEMSFTPTGFGSGVVSFTIPLAF